MNHSSIVISADMPSSVYFSNKMALPVLIASFKVCTRSKNRKKLRIGVRYLGLNATTELC